MVMKLNKMVLDDKEIEEAARRNADKYRNYPTLSDEDRDKVSIGSFMDCAKWMQEEFLKDLWHPASEEPKRHSYIMFKTTNNNGFGTEYIDCSWEILVRCLQITQWLYAEDLLPKEGGDGK